MKQSRSPLGWRDYLLLVFLLVGTVCFAIWCPRSNVNSVGGDHYTALCLENLKAIGQAYQLYEHDFDGKLPRGADPEDRAYSQQWRYGAGGSFYQDALRKAPLLQDLLLPYVPSKEVFHCPADVGWYRRRLPIGDPGNTDVHPSSFAKFGSSYYCLTIYNFRDMTPADLWNPSGTLLLFDGDLWHGDGDDSANGLFADGHTANLTRQQFFRYLGN